MPPFLALIIIYLCLQVVKFRRKERVEIGDGGHKDGMRYIRAQQNAVEYVPIALILMGAYELNNGSTLWLHAVGIGLVMGRVLHPMGFVRKRGINFGRFYGTALTWLAILILAGLNIFQFARTLF